MTEFTPIAALVERATDREGRQIYRELYGVPQDAEHLALHSWDEWRLLPFLTKSLLQKIPLRDKLFLPWTSMSSIHASSGTSGQPPLFSPWMRIDGYEYRERFHVFTRPALCSMPIPHQHDRYLEERGVVPRMIVFDPKRAAASVKLAKLASVDSLFTFTGHLQLIGPEMKKLGMTGDIRFIEIAGESCSRALYRYVKKTFPNAVFVSFYGATEVENPPITTPCRPLSDAEPLEVHHPRDGYYIELIDPATRELVPIERGAEGELVLSFDTSLPAKPAIFPLVRYRSGDMARVVDAQCEEHGAWSFTMLGRAEMDFIKVPGGILRADEIERVLRGIPEKTSDIFELHLREQESEGILHVEVILKIDAPENADFSALAAYISRNFHIGPSFTYEDGVERGLYRPFVCAPLPPSPFKGKRNRMIRD